MDIHTDKLFGVPVYETLLYDFEQHQSELIDYILALRSVEPGEARSNHGGWHSSGTLFEHSHPDVQWMVRNLHKFTHNCVKHVLQSEAFGLELRDMWANINDAGHWNAPHVHIPRSWSGVCYVKVNESPDESGLVADEGDLLFFNPVPLSKWYNRQVTLPYKPRNGGIVLFPSHLVHMVCPHNEPEPRISVAFNVDVEEEND